MSNYDDYVSNETKILHEAVCIIKMYIIPGASIKHCIEFWNGDANKADKPAIFDKSIKRLCEIFEHSNSTHGQNFDDFIKEDLLEIIYSKIKQNNHYEIKIRLDDISNSI